MVKAPSGCDEEIGSEVNYIFKEDSCGLFAPTCANERACATRDERNLVARAAHLARFDSCDQGLSLQYSTRPLKRDAYRLRRRAVDASQRITVTVCGEGCETLIE